MSRLIYKSGTKNKHDVTLLTHLRDESYGNQNRIRSVWLAQCPCGKEFTVTNGQFSRIMSCGCARGTANRKRLVTHDRSSSTEYIIWASMKARCNNPNDVNYHRYGARGITICEDWLDFNNFYRDMGKRPSKNHSLERIDNNDGYKASNCKWATRKEQANNRRSNVKITYNGETKTIAEWATFCGLSVVTLWSRLYRYGWTIEEAITKPKKGSIK